MKTLVIGGGPAGMMAAAASAAQGHETHLYEKNEKLGKKLYITGKGRCNLTNDCSREVFFDQIMRNPRFMFSAFGAMDNRGLMTMIEKAGCPLKVERGQRVFPVSDKSSDIIRAFGRILQEAGVHVHLNAPVEALMVEAGGEKSLVRGLRLKSGEEVEGDRVILATGGLSYRSTGSDGFGMKLAEELGHRIVPCRPSLVGLLTREHWPAALQGLSLRNVAVTLYRGSKKIDWEQGEMLFTHFGVSGPLILTQSARVAGDPADYSLMLDLKPALDESQIRLRVQRDLEKYHNKQFINAMGDLLPTKLIPVFADLTGIPRDKRVNQLTKKERQSIEKLLKGLQIHITGFAPMDTAIITAGGVDVREIDPRTMASKKAEGLYFAGEMIDVDALTGGFNIQIAASTGWLAGQTDKRRKESADRH